jgi:methylenetetrahydrofolate reductase (NADPH)
LPTHNKKIVHHNICAHNELLELNEIFTEDLHDSTAATGKTTAPLLDVGAQKIRIQCMKYIRDVYAERRAQKVPAISFEFHPAKTPEAEATLIQKTIPTLSHLAPDFCSVTYGAGGSTQHKTLEIVDGIQRKHNLIGMTHLTCVNANRDKINLVLEQARVLGIINVLALRGDPPDGGEFKKTEGGFEYSKELVAFIRQKGGFSIGTAGFPEGHIACKEGKYVDWQRLKDKIECGSDFVLTQLFWDNSDFYEFYEHLTVKLGVKVPISPGIMPMVSSKQIKHISKLCGARWPAEVLAKLEQLGEDDEAVTQFGIEFATKQCEALLKFGVPGLHLYTMNRVRSVREILKNLKLRTPVPSV